MKKINFLGRATLFGLIAAFAVSAIPTDANAISRYNSKSMTCSAIKAAINNEGAVILDTANGIFDRYVRNRNQCLVNQTTKRRSVPAADTSKCRVRYCIERRKLEIFD